MAAPGHGTPPRKIPNCVKELARQSRRRLTCSLSRRADTGFQDEDLQPRRARRKTQGGGGRRRAKRSRREEEKKYAVVRVCQLRMIVGWLSFTPPCVFFRAPYGRPSSFGQKSPQALLPDIDSVTAGKKRGFCHLLNYTAQTRVFSVAPNPTATPRRLCVPRRPGRCRSGTPHRDPLLRGRSDVQ